jgi:putative transposase
MANENGWRAPRIHAELRKLGFDVSERTVSRYLPKQPVAPGAIKQWKTFLRNHRDVLAAMDFFTVPTASFRVLYVLFVVHHDRRQLLHLGVTAHPTADWIIGQLREAFPFDTAPRYLILDGDRKFRGRVKAAIRNMGIEPTRTAYRSPWQNGVAERLVGSIRRELLDHVVVANENHLRRLLGDYQAYYSEDRCHLTLGKDTPVPRLIEPRPSPTVKVTALPRVGGIHHRYVWSEQRAKAA